MHLDSTALPIPVKQPLYAQLYFQVVLAIVAGALLGHFEPALAGAMKPLAMASSSW